MALSEETIPHQLALIQNRITCTSSSVQADQANPLFTFGGWNWVAENCWESGRLKKRPRFGGRAVGTTTRTVASDAPVGETVLFSHFAGCFTFEANGAGACSM